VSHETPMSLSGGHSRGRITCSSPAYCQHPFASGRLGYGQDHLVLRAAPPGPCSTTGAALPWAPELHSGPVEAAGDGGTLAVGREVHGPVDLPRYGPSTDLFPPRTPGPRAWWYRPHPDVNMSLPVSCRPARTATAGEPPGCPARLSLRSPVWSDHTHPDLPSVAGSRERPLPSPKTRPPRSAWTFVPSSVFHCILSYCPRPRA